MTAQNISILIADDHTIMRHGIKSVLNPEINFTVIGETNGADETIEKVEELKPDILILDLGLPEKSGIEVIYAIEERKLETNIIVLTQHDDEAMITQALGAGAKAYILKDFSPESLVATIARVLDGEIILPEKFEHLRTDILKRRDSSASTERLSSDDPLSKLSKREREIFFHLANGMPNRAIAKKLFISPRTVETHRARVIKKLGFSSTADLIRYAIKHNLLTP